MPFRRRLAVWEPLLLHGLVFTRAAVNARPEVQDAFHGMVRTYVRLGWLDPVATQLCVICHGHAQVWHHPSYARGFHDVVQPACDRCHTKYHSVALRQFVKDGAAVHHWRIWHAADMEGVVNALIDEIDAKKLQKGNPDA